MACSASSRVSLSASWLRAPCSCSARKAESAPTSRNAERFAAITTASRPGGSGVRSTYVATGTTKPASMLQASTQKAIDDAAAPSAAPRRPRPIAPETMASG